MLGVNDVGMDDDFFNLGGHSLLAVALVAALREGFGVELPLRAVFESATPAALLGSLGSIPDGDSDRTGQVPSQTLDAWARAAKAHRPNRLPLSYAQSRLWFLNQLDPGAADYNIVLAVRLTGDLNEEALALALDDLVARHEVLRTSYPATDGSPEQLIHPAATVPKLLKVEEAGALGDLPRLLTDGASRGFDLLRELPLRATLIRLDDDEWVLQLVIHHIASDGASLAPLARDISTAYTARCCGASPCSALGAAVCRLRPLAAACAGRHSGHQDGWAR